MTHSLLQIYVHVVFSTKNRMDMIWSDDLAPLHAYMAGVLSKMGCTTIVVGGVANHVHVLCKLGGKVGVVDMVAQLKRSTTFWLGRRKPCYWQFAWQEGAGVFSVSALHVNAVRQYIANQAEHHRTISFEDEYRRLLHRNGIYDDDRTTT